MVKDHKQDLSEFQTEASSGQDQTVKDAANQGSKIIAQHLQMIQQIAKDQSGNMASK
jgi:putative membrane protein